MDKFSGVIKLSGLDDFISPGVECIKPIENTSNIPKKKAKVLVTDNGNYNEVDITTGKTTKLEKAKISLKDCLACSGCVTSAETVLINQQSVTEFFSILDNKSKTVVVSISPQSRAAIASHFNLTINQANQKLKILFNKLGIEYVFDTTFSRDFSLLESRVEFVEKFKESLEKKTNMTILNSTCPGWICYAEKTCGDYVLPYISSVKSPQQIMGSLVKYYFSEKVGKKADEIYHVSVMPCYDKKLEASRSEFFNDILRTRDVDTVLTSTEILEIISSKNFDFLGSEFETNNNEITNNDNNNNNEMINDNNLNSLQNLFDTYNENGDLVSGTMGGSGGYAEYIFKYAAKVLFNQEVDKLEWKKQRNVDFQELFLEISGKKVLSFALAYGFRNIQNIVRKIKSGTCNYHYVEVMACPSGCLNGGGQIKKNTNDREEQRNNLKEIENLYQNVQLQLPQENLLVTNLYKDWIKDDVYSINARKWLHITYKPIQKDQSSLIIKW